MTNPAYKPFDLQAAIAGKPIVRRDGTPVKFVTYHEGVTDGYPVVVIVNGTLNSYMADGSAYDDGEDDLDLVMVTEKKKVWINTYKEWDGEVNAISYRSEHEAKHDSESNGFRETIVREYDI